HGGLDHHPRIELAKGVRQRLHQLLGVEEAGAHTALGGLVAGGRVLVGRQGGSRHEVLPLYVGGHHASPSASGPSASAGKYVRPVMMMIVPTSSPVYSGLSVRRVPAVAGTGFCSASEPASASTNTIGRNRPRSIARPIVVLNHCVSAFRPANAEPLLFAPDV